MISRVSVDRAKLIYSQCSSYIRLPTFSFLRLVFTSDGVEVGVIIRSVERYELVKIKPTKSEVEHCEGWFSIATE